MDFGANEVLKAMPRLFWPQYDWQLGYSNMFRLGRAWHVYCTPEGKRAFQAKHGLDLELFLMAAFGLYVATTERPAVRPEYLKALGVTSAQVQLFGRAIGHTIEGHTVLAKETSNPRIPRAFQRNVIKERPLFEVSDHGGKAYFVPSRANLMLRITDGLYYDIVADPDARRRSGEAFEELCLELSRFHFAASCYVSPERRTSYGRSADILIEGNAENSGLILECKIRRIPERVLVSPDPWRDCSNDFNDIIKGIVQIWRTQQEIYSSSSRRMAGLVVQYDPWTVMGNAFIQRLFDEAHTRADAIGVERSNRIPVALAGYADVESSFRACSIGTLQNAIQESNTEKFRGYELSTILREINGNPDIDRPVFDYERLAQAAVPWLGKID